MNFRICVSIYGCEHNFGQWTVGTSFESLWKLVVKPYSITRLARRTQGKLVKGTIMQWQVD